MHFRKCGKHNLELSALGAGCWAFGGGNYWGDQSQKDVEEVVHCAVEHGVNYFDTAESYNNGRSEISLGQAIKSLRREQVVIGTKASPSNCYSHTLIEHCERSLQRLGTDYIDIYMIHWPISPKSYESFTSGEVEVIRPPSLEEATCSLAKLQEQGKIKHVGLSNFGPERLKEVLDLGIDVVANELPYSLLTRAIEREIMPMSKNLGIGIIGYMTLLQGILADIYPSLSKIPKRLCRTRHFSHASSELSRHGEAGVEDETDRALENIRSIMKEINVSMPNIALRWALANNAITTALVGARNKIEMLANLKAAMEPLEEGVAGELNSATDKLKEALGKSFDYYQKSKDDRTR